MHMYVCVPLRTYACSRGFICHTLLYAVQRLWCASELFQVSLFQCSHSHSPTSESKNSSTHRRKALR